jgi:hypothetical protein
MSDLIRKKTIGEAWETGIGVDGNGGATIHLDAAALEPIAFTTPGDGTLDLFLEYRVLDISALT